MRGAHRLRHQPLPACGLVSRVLLPVPPVYLGLPVLHLNRRRLAEALRNAIARTVAALLERPLRTETASRWPLAAACCANTAKALTSVTNE